MSQNNGEQHSVDEIIISQNDGLVGRRWSYLKYGGPGKVPGYVELVLFGSAEDISELPHDPEIIAPGSICYIPDLSSDVYLVLNNAGQWVMPGEPADDEPADGPEPGGSENIM